MSDITVIKDKILLDHNDMIRLLSSLDTKPLTRDSNGYDIGYNKAKEEILSIVLSSLNKNWDIDYKRSIATQVIRELRERKK